VEIPPTFTFTFFLNSSSLGEGLLFKQNAQSEMLRQPQTTLGQP